MAELRRDNIFERFVIIPDNNKKDSNDSKCPYCAGNEPLTGPTVLALIQKDGILKRVYDDSEEYNNWCVRVFPSNEPLVTENNDTIYTEIPFAREPAFGYHYIVVITPTHENPAKLSADHWSNVLVALQDRIKWLYSKKGVTYASIFMHHRKGIHPHMNIVTFPEVPPLIERSATVIHNYIKERSSCPVCDIVKSEINGARQVFSSRYFIAICPWASPSPYNIRIIPQKHITSFMKITQKDIEDLSSLLRITLGALYNSTNNEEFNLVFHLPPEKKESKQFHWCIELYPNNNNTNTLGDEFGIHINRLKPEDAAAKLANAARKEFALLAGITS